MAAIFQIRRGETNINIADGELYLHKGSGSVQFGSGSTSYNLLPLNAPAYGDINLSGSITASGDVRIGGNIYLGNATADNISALGQFTTNLVPTPHNSIDIGTISAYWRNVYATSITGAIAATNGVVSGSSQLANVFEEKASSTHTLVSSSSQIISILDSLNTFSGSQLTQNSNLATISGSLILTASTNTISITNLNSFSASQLDKDLVIQNYTASVENRLTQIGVVSGSLILTASNHEIRLDEIESYTSSLKTAISVFNENVTIQGDLTVNGITTHINSTQVDIGDNIISLNGTRIANGGIYIFDPTSPNIGTGSLLWDTTNDYWKAGVKDAESKILLAGGDGVLSSSLQLTEINNTTESLNRSTASLNSFSASVTASLESVYQTTASLNLFTSSTTNRLTNLESKSASVDISILNLNTFSGSQLTQNSNLSTYTTSVESRFSTLATYTGSINTKLTEIGVVSSSLILTASNHEQRLDELETKSASVDVNIVNIHTFTSSASQSIWELYSSASNHEGRIDYIEGVAFGGLDLNAQFTAIGLVTGSLQQFTASANSRFTNIEAATSSYETKGRGIVSGSSQLASAFEEIASSTHTLVSGSSQVIGILSSLNTFTASLDATYATEAEVAAGYEAKGRGIFSSSLQLPSGVVSGSSQINGANITTNNITIAGTSVTLGGSITAAKILEGTNVISSSAQIVSVLPSGVVSGSSQIDLTQTTNYASGILARLNVVGVVSGSSQISLGSAAGNIALATQTTGDYVASLVQGTGVTITNNSGENATPTIAIGQAVGTSANVEFSSIGVGTTASGIAGEIRATGDITAFHSSDIRLKENIVPITNALEKVNQISGNTYDWKEGYDEVHSHKGNDVGVIAQEIEAILPQIVTNRDTGFKAVQYEKIIPLLIEAIKELSSKVDRLENK